MPAETHDLKFLTRHWFDQVWNNRKEHVIHEMIHPGARGFGLSEGSQPITVEGFIPFYQRFLGAFPDLRIAVEDVLVDGDQSACRVRAEGTHTGAHFGVPPTNKTVAFTGIIWMRWRDGKITESWNEFDAWGLMQQLTGPPPMKVK